MTRQAGAAAVDGVVDAMGATILVGKLREDERRRVELHPALQLGESAAGFRHDHRGLRGPVSGLAMTQPNPFTVTSRCPRGRQGTGGAGADTPTVMRATDVRPALSLTCRLT